MKKYLLFLGSLFLIFNSLAQVPQPERSALISLYNSTNGNQWYNKHNWNTANPVSTWYGVTTSIIDGIEHVYTINLYNNNLNGTIPVEIMNLSKLNLLNLPNNMLYGTVPYQVQQLENLANLNLKGNNMNYENIPVKPTEIIITKPEKEKIEEKADKLISPKEYIKIIDFKGYLLSPKLIKKLDEVVTIIKQNGDLNFLIDCFSSYEVNTSKNLETSDALKESVIAYLDGSEISKNRYIIRSLGENYAGINLSNLINNENDSRILIQVLSKDINSITKELAAKKEPPKVEKIEPIPFNALNEPPIYPGCEGDNEKLKKCFIDSIGTLVEEKFNEEVAQDLGIKKGKNNVAVSIVVDTDGNISEILTKGPHKNIEIEARRVMELIPNMRPGRKKGKNVFFNYLLKINFKIKK